jgi:hypothetical protein
MQIKEGRLAKIGFKTAVIENDNVSTTETRNIKTNRSEKRIYFLNLP